MKNPGENLNKKEKYQQQLNNILSVDLTAENINTYSDDALNSLIGLIDEVKNDPACKWDFSLNVSAKEQEDKTLRQVLGVDVGHILESISRIGDDIKHLDDIIDDCRQHEEQMTYIPSDKLGYAAIVANGGDFSMAPIVPKTKVALFVLENDFGINLDNEEEFQMSTGINTEDMMRQVSYDIINLPTLNRAIASCDETGNVTFIFNTSVLTENNLSIDDIKKMTKQEIKDLLAKSPALGATLIYSKNYPSNLAKLIEKPITELEKQIEDNPDQFSQGRKYLKEVMKAPDGWTTMGTFEKAYGISHQTLIKLVEGAGSIESREYKMRGRGGKVCQHYKEEDLKELASSLLNTEKAPDGWTTPSVFARKHGIHPNTINRTIEGAGNIESREYKMGGRGGKVCRHYKEEDLNRLVSPLLYTEKVPDGWTTITAFAEKYGISDRTISKIIKNAGDIESREFKKQGKVCQHYKEEDLKELASSLLNTEKAPDGWTTPSVFARKHGIHPNTINRIVEGAGDIESRKFKDRAGKVGVHYKEEDLKELASSLLNTEEAPDGWITMGAFEKSHKIDHDTLGKLVEGAGNIESREYKMRGRGGKVYMYYKEEDLKELASSLLNTEKAPDGWTTMNAFEKSHKITHDTLVKLIDGAGNIESKEYKNKTGQGAQIYLHYREEDLEKLIEPFVNIEKAPDEWTTMHAFEKAHKIDHDTLVKLINGAGNIESKEYRIKQGMVRLHYKEEDLNSLLAEKNKK